MKKSSANSEKVRMNEIPKSVRDILAQLNQSSIVSISQQPNRSLVRFDFILGTGTCYAIELYLVARFSFTKAFHYDADLVGVSNITLDLLEEERKEILDSIGSGRRNNSGDPAINNSGPAYHLRIEGDISFDVICGLYKMFQEARVEDGSPST